MNRDQVVNVLKSLANGIDPASGAPIPLDVFQSAETVQALAAASELLENGRSRNPSLPAAGSRWDEAEDARLSSEFDAGMSVAQIALQHGRTSSAITLRLVKLGRIDPATVQSRDRGARVPPS
jgi:hypothetical protein